MPAYALVVNPAATKAFRKLDAAVLLRIVAALDSLREEPRPQGARKLAGLDDVWRIRVGAYRVLYAIEDDRLLVLLVLKIGPRRDVYRGL